MDKLNEDVSQTRRTLLDRYGDGIAQALKGADSEIAAHALRVIRASLDVLADCDGVGPETHDTITHAADILSEAEFQIEAQGVIPPVRSINSGLSEAATCLLGLKIRAQPEKVSRIEIGTGTAPLTVGRASR